MVRQNGTWALWSRGNNPTALTQWTNVTEHEKFATLEELLPAFLVMKAQGQHVRLEWMPENAYGQPAKEAKAEPDLSAETDAQLTTELESMKSGFGYV